MPEPPVLSKREAARVAKVRDALLAHALAHDGAWEDHPWGESVAKVGKKVFVFLGVSPWTSVTVKLPSSGAGVLALPCATPAGYGLGKWGWVTIDLAGDGCPPPPVLMELIDESYAAVAARKTEGRPPRAKKLASSRSR